MKKATLLKAIFGLALVLMTSAAWGQANTPKDTVDVINYLNAAFFEVNQDGLGNTAIGLGSTTGANASAHTNLVTVGASGGTTLVELTGTVTDTTTYYSTSTPTYQFYIPMVVTPDAVLNPSAFSAGGAFTHANLESSWAWGLDNDYLTSGMDGATSATLDNIRNVPAAYTGKGGVLTAAAFNQKVLKTGTDVETFRVHVAENSVTSDYSSVLCVGDSAYVEFSVIASPTGSENTTDSDEDVEECLSTLEDTQYSLVINLTGYPPFAIGYYINEATISAGTPTNSWTYTHVLTGSTTGSTSTDQATKYQGTLTGSGTSWKYTIQLGIDEDASSGYTNTIAMDGAGKITKYQVGVKWVNDLISRKSDRLGTYLSPSIAAEADSHVLFDASGHLAITMYPTPETGNIFTLPN